jgi:hypothetical protein
MTTFDRKIYFDSIRESLFGSMDQRQVDGQEFILTAWETYVPDDDIRFLANFLAQTYHETGAALWPIEEYGKGAGHDYGEPDPETGEAYYGRGFIQCTWKSNYERADNELGLTGDDSCVWHADKQLDPSISARTGYAGMKQGWFRSDSNGPHNLPRYFNDTVDDPYNARNIINGDRTTVPDWSGGVSIGKLIEGYHDHFLEALQAAAIENVEPEPEPEPTPEEHVDIAIVRSSPNVLVSITLDGELVVASKLETA